MRYDVGQWCTIYRGVKCRVSGSGPPEPKGQSASGDALNESRNLTQSKPDTRRQSANPRSVQPVDAARWAKMAYWTPEEAACVTVGYEPESVWPLTLEEVPANEKEIEAVDCRFVYICREIDIGRLDPKLQPKDVFRWLDAIGEDYPPKLYEVANKIKPYGRMVDADPGIGRDVGTGTPHSSGEPILPYNSSALVRKNATLRKMILAMAIDCYGFDREAKRSTTVSDIESALHRAGLELSDDTIRTHLKDAADAYWINQEK